MFKRVVSSLIMISMIWLDIAKAMEAGDEEHSGIVLPKGGSQGRKIEQGQVVQDLTPQTQATVNILPRSSGEEEGKSSPERPTILDAHKEKLRAKDEEKSVVFDGDKGKRSKKDNKVTRSESIEMKARGSFRRDEENNGVNLNFGSWRNLHSDQKVELDEFLNGSKDLDESSPLLAEKQGEVSFGINGHPSDFGDAHRKHGQKNSLHSEELHKKRSFRLKRRINDSLPRTILPIPQALELKGDGLITKSLANIGSVSLADLDWTFVVVEGDGENELRGFYIPSFKNIPAEAKMFLRHVKRQDIDDRDLWKHWFAKGTGIGLGAWFAFAMWPVYNGGLIYLRDRYEWSWLNNIEESGPLGYITLAYIFSTLFPDSAARNSNLLKRAISNVSQQNISKTRVLLTAGASILPSLTTPVYLILMETHNMAVTKTTGIDNQFAIATLALTPPLFADNFFASFEMLWDMTDEFHEDLERLSSFTRKNVLRFPPRMKSPEEVQREEYSSALEKLGFYLFRAPSEKADQVYNDISNARTTIAAALPGLSKEELDTAEAFFVMRYCLALADEIEEGEKAAKSLYEFLTDSFTYGCLLTGSPVRLAVLQLTAATVLSLLFSNTISNYAGLAVGTVAFPFQTMLEYKGMQWFFRDFVWYEEPNGHQSMPPLRWSAKVAAALQSVLQTLPLGVFTMQAINLLLASDYWMIASVPFLIAEFLTLVTFFNDTYNRKVGTAVTNVYNKKLRKVFKASPRTDWKKDYLVRMVKASQERVKTASPYLLEKLKQSLTVDEEL